jgi:hypothetical protein
MDQVKAGMEDQRTYSSPINLEINQTQTKRLLVWVIKALPLLIQMLLEHLKPVMNILMCLVAIKRLLFSLPTYLISNNIQYCLIILQLSLMLYLG